MNSNRLIQLLSIIGMFACLAGAAMLGGPINSQRKELQLTYNPEQDESIPKSIVLTQAALGSFRGIFVDILWMRAHDMKQAGLYREAEQLSKIICTLQPRFPKVWAFRAWDMAYNISVATHTPEERWNWVNKGIRLLRDQGVVHCPDSVLIKKELAWIYFHKIGQMADDAHWYYRRKIAEEWQQILGSPEGLTEEEIIQRMRQVAEAPDTVEQLLQDPDAARLVDYFATLGYELDVRLLREIGKILMLDMGRDIIFFSSDIQEQVTQSVDGRIHQARQDPELVPAFPKLVWYLRKKVLRENYHMDPAYMYKMMAPKVSEASTPGSTTEPTPELTEISFVESTDEGSELSEFGYGFGPIDWRHPSAHSAYWAGQGIEVAKKLRNKRDIDQLNTDRVVIHSMQDLFRTGRMTYDVITGHIDLMPDPRFIDSYRASYEAGSQRLESGEYRDTVQSNYDKGFENFLLQAMRFCYLYGEEKRAGDYYKEWYEKFSDQPYNEKEREMQIAELIIHEMRKTNNMWSNMKQFIDAMLRRAFLHGMAHYDGKVFNKFFTLARQAYDQHHKNKNISKLGEKRLGMRPWNELVIESYVELMINPSINIISRGRIWRSTPLMNEHLPRHVYDRIRPVVHVHAQQAGLDPELLLPEPVGMAEYRKEQDTKRAEEQPQRNYTERQ